MRAVFVAFFIGMFGVFGCLNCQSIERTERVDFKIKETRYVKIRVVVEEYVLKLEVPEFSVLNLPVTGPPKKAELLTIPARSPTEITKDLQYAEEKLKDIKIKFCLESIRFVTPQRKAINTSTDLAEYHDPLEAEKDDCVTIYYIFRGLGISSWAGISNMPWHPERRIVLLGSCDGGSFAHEFGHYLGLHHTFDNDDYVDDTAKTDKLIDFDKTHGKGTLGVKDKDPNYDNIMTYYNDATISRFTSGQLKRMDFFLRIYRPAIVMEQYIGFPLDHEISSRFLKSREEYTRSILNNSSVPYACDEELEKVLIETGFIQPKLKGVPMIMFRPMSYQSLP